MTYQNDISWLQKRHPTLSQTKLEAFAHKVAHFFQEEPNWSEEDVRNHILEVMIKHKEL